MEGRRTSYYKVIYEVARAANSTLTVNEVLSSIVESTTKAMDAKGCSLMLLTPNREQLLHSAAYGLSDWYVRKGPVRADQSLSEALEGKAVAVVHATEDPRVQYREQARKEGIASILCVPLRLKEEVIGVMRLYTASPREFSEEEIEFLGAIANLGAIAIENARLYESLKQSYEEVRKDLAEWYATWGLERSADAVAGPPPEG